MRRNTIRFEGITLSPSGNEVARFTYITEFTLRPGQALLVFKAGDWQPLRKVLYPIQILPEGFIAHAAPEPTWQLGDMLSVYGPVGTGFSPPQMAERWLLASFQIPPDKLLALLQPGLERGAAIALYADQLPTNLPPQVEFVEYFHDASSWADYLAIDLPLTFLHSLKSKLSDNDGGTTPISTQVLITQDLPCGIGACYACGMKGRNGLVRACTAGPVFELDQLEY